MARYLWGKVALDTEAGKYEDAIDSLQRGILIWEKSFGPNHPDLAWALGLLAENPPLIACHAVRCLGIAHRPAEGFYSSRRAAMGSSCAARRAGK
jgi:Tetratricopeptide repeat